MKQILIILGLFASVSTFAQSPRIKLNQITKDTVKGSVLISSPSDSGMVYSRDFYVAYGLTDTVLILYGDTLAATSGIISSVLSDGVTITGNGTSGNELKVDTSLIATIKALNDSLATISASTTPDNVTITGDGSVGNPLKVDTATVISTIKGLVDTLTARGYLTANQTITLSGDVTGSGTTAITATVVDDSHNHIISNVDNLQDSLDAKANDSDLANYVTLSGTETITGAKTFTNTFTQSGGDANFDSGTLFVDESANKVGIGTSSPSATLSGITEAEDATRESLIDFKLSDAGDAVFGVVNGTSANTKFVPTFYGYQTDDNLSHALSFRGFIGTNADTAIVPPIIKFQALMTTDGTNPNNNTSSTPISNRPLFGFQNANNYLMTILANGNVGIGTSSPSEKLDVNGNARFRSIGSGASAGALHYTSTGVLTTNTSDARLKTNLQPLENTLNKLLGINTYTFNWIDETDRVDLGMIAQEVEQIFPNLVFTNNVDGYKGIHYDKFSSILTKAIQEQQAQIETIQTELDAKSLIIETQASEIDQLKTLITDLTNRLIILENK